MLLMKLLCDKSFNHDFSTLRHCSKEAEKHTNGGSAKSAQAREQQPEFPA
jgi:hypothetical protein